jgi:hypothetical protein
VLARYDQTVDIFIIVLIILGVDALVVYGIAAGMASSWNVMAREFPGVEPSPDAVRRSFQSFAMGIFNMGWCVHVAVDDERLHLMPARLMRVAGAKTISVPWDRVEYVRAPRRGRGACVRIAKRELMGPAWALDLAKGEGA